MAKKETKNVVKEENKKKNTTSKEVKKKVNVSPKKTSSKAVTSKKTEAKSKTEKAAKTSKAATSRKTEAKSKTGKSAKVSKETAKKAPAKVQAKVSTKATAKTVAKKRSTKKKVTVDESTAKPMLAEYYDLPYRYNQTIVKILAQTPTTLFVYWDISDNDRNALISSHGDNFFYETKPVLIIHNITRNYSFEIEINDFANSWYIRTQEPNCDYIIELGRRFNENKQDYIYINSSNDIVSPNDHILFEKTDLRNLLFKNIKTNALSSKDFGSLDFINNIDKLYGNIYDVYSALYNDEQLNELANPSSGEFIRK